MAAPNVAVSGGASVVGGGAPGEAQTMTAQRVEGAQRLAHFYAAGWGPPGIEAGGASFFLFPARPPARPRCYGPSVLAWQRAALRCAARRRDRAQWPRAAAPTQEKLRPQRAPVRSD